MDHLHVRVLGPLELERTGQPLDLPGTLQRRLFLRLLLAEGASVTTDALIDAVWGDAPPSSARNTLQSHVARLRDALGDAEVIATTANGYALAMDRLVVDADTFTAAVRDSRDRIAAEPQRCVAVLSTALATWRGQPYADGADLAAPVAARLEGLRLEARRALGRARAGSGDLAGAIEELTVLAAEQPLQEDVTLTLAVALAEARRTPDALAVLRELRAALADELGLDPSPAVAELEQRLLRGELQASPVRTVPEHPDETSVDRSLAPVPATPTYGREDDLARVLEALGSAGLVTLVGPGGVGKTRLAMLACAESSDTRWPTAGWVDLARVLDGRDVPAAVIDALTARTHGTDDLGAAAAEALARAGGTVVLDNCEHVLDAVAALVTAVLRRPHSTRLLATSTERLDVDGERVVRVAPLPVPTAGHATPDTPPIALFRDRLLAAGGAPVEVEDAAAVVAAVDGLPLAIELAAARAATLPIPALLERLREHLDVLDRSRARGDARHRTLRGVIAWSHGLLDADEQLLYRRLAAFTASFRLTDVTSICAGDDLAPTTAADVLGRLVERSMVVRLGPDRYRLLEPIRLDAAERLAASGDHESVLDRQRWAALELAARAGEQMGTDVEAAVVEELLAALPDLRAVHARALAAGDLATVGALTSGLFRFAYDQARRDLLAWGDPLVDAREVVGTDVWAGAVAASLTGLTLAGRSADGAALADVLASALDALGDPSARLATEAIGDHQLITGNLDAALTTYERNAGLADRSGHLGAIALATVNLALTRTYTGQLDAAVPTAERAVTLAERCGAPGTRAFAYFSLGEALSDVDPPGALAAFERSIATAEAAGARFIEGIARIADVAVRGRHGDATVALERYRSAIGLWLDAGAHGFLLTALRNLVSLLGRVGADADAVTLATALDALADRPSFGGEAHRLASATTAASARLPADDGAAARGRAAAFGDLASVARYHLGVIERIIAQG